MVWSSGPLSGKDIVNRPVGVYRKKLSSDFRFGDVWILWSNAPGSHGCLGELHRIKTCNNTCHCYRNTISLSITKQAAHMSMNRVLRRFCSMNFLNKERWHKPSLSSFWNTSALRCTLVSAEQNDDSRMYSEVKISLESDRDSSVFTWSRMGKTQRNT